MKKLDQVRVLSQSDKELMLDLKSIAARFVPDAILILYGSAARGHRGPESDYDVLVLLEHSIEKTTREEMRSAIYEMELRRGVVVSLMVSTREEWNSPMRRVSPFRRNVESEGVLL